MKTLTRLLPLLLLAAAAAGCAAGTRLRADAVRKPLQAVAARHDAYVKADASLPPGALADDLAESMTLRASVDPAGPKALDPAALDGVLRAVALRHDAYVVADPAAAPLEKRVWLRDTALLRRAFDASLGRPARPAVTPN